MPSNGVVLVIVASILLLVDRVQSAEWKIVNTIGVPKPREEACFVMVNEKAYLLGGRGINPASVYDPQTRKWVNRTRSPLELHHMQCVAVGTNIYIVSAYTGSYPKEKTVPDVWVYDTVANAWRNKTGLPASRRRGSAASVAIGNEIYVSHGSYGGHGIYGTAVAWLDKYNVLTDSWTIGLADARYPRDHTGGGLVNGKICIAAGRKAGMADFFNATVLPTECYDVATNTWSVHANITQGRAGSAYGTTCDGKLMVAGGEGYATAWSNVDVFDGTSWSSRPSLKTPRHGTGLAVSCSCRQIHIASGSPDQGGSFTLNTTETLFPDGIDRICSPSLAPSSSPSATPSIVTSKIPSAAPSIAPTGMPIVVPSAAPSAVNSAAPSIAPSSAPSIVPSAAPSAVNSAAPSIAPSSALSSAPSIVPSAAPSTVNSAAPSIAPSAAPSAVNSAAPSIVPSAAPSAVNSAAPSSAPGSAPSSAPSTVPTAAQSTAPSQMPSTEPSPNFNIVSVPTTPGVTYANINAGGGTYQDIRGRLWEGDKYFTGGKAFVLKNEVNIARTEDDTLYWSQRRGNVTYKIPLSPGPYNVSLHFAELSIKTPGTRLFDVQIEGTLVLSNFDIYSTYGFRRAGIVSRTLSILDGYLDVTLLGGDGVISAIEASSLLNSQ